MSSSNAIGELRPPAADISGSEPRHRDVSEGEPWFRPGTPTPEDGDRPRHERGPRHYGDGGLANWPDESVTMPGLKMPASFAEPPAQAPVVPTAAVGLIGSGYLDDVPGLMSGENAVDPIEVPVGEIADGAAAGAASAALDDKPADGEEAADGVEEEVPQRGSILNRLTVLLGTTRGKWIAAGVGAAVIVLIALSVVLAVRSNKPSTADVSPVSDSSSASTSSGPPLPDSTIAPIAPPLDTPAPLPPDSLGGAAAEPDPFVGSPSGAVPNTTLPPDDLSATDPAAVPPPPGAATTPQDPGAYDPELDGPIGHDQSRSGMPQDGLGPAPRPNDRATTPRNAGPLGSLDSITKPESPDSSSPSDTGSTGHKKSFGDGLGGLGHGL